MKLKSHLAPPAIRQAFSAAVIEWTQDSTLKREPTVTVRGEQLTLRQLAGYVWRDPRGMPTEACHALDGWDGIEVPVGCSFGKAARLVHRLLNETEVLRLANEAARSGSQRRSVQGTVDDAFAKGSRLVWSPGDIVIEGKRGTYRRRA